MSTELRSTTLGELCKIELGKTPARGNSKYWDKDRVTDNVWLSIADMPQHHRAIIHDSKEYISDEGASLCKIVKEGTLLVSFKLTLGRLAVAGRDIYTNEAIAALTINDESLISKDYLYYYLTFFDWQKAAEGDHKIKGKTLNKAKLKLIKIVFPEPEEQKRIVAILDEAFTEIDTAIANTEKNLANARELFESYLNSVFSKAGKDWVQETMNAACDLITCGVAATPKYVDESVGVPFLSAQNVKNGEVTLHKYRFITKELHEHLTKKNKPQKGDILYSRVGAGFGEAAVVEHSFDFSVYVSLTLIKPISEKLDSYFLKYYLNSPEIKGIAKKSITSSGVPNLNVKTVREFPVTYPSLQKQKDLVVEIKSVEEEVLRLQGIYEKKLNLLKELKQILLQKAFSGELTTDNKKLMDEAAA